MSHEHSSQRCTYEVKEIGSHQKHKISYDKVFYGANKIRQEMKEEVIKTQQPPRQVYEKHTTNNLKGDVTCIGKYNSLKQTLYRAAYGDKPKTPAIARDFEITLRELLEKNSSYLYNKYGIEEFYDERMKQQYIFIHPTNPEILMFQTHAQNAMFKNADTVMCDGTMKITPRIGKNHRPWPQVFNILIIIEGEWGASTAYLGILLFFFALCKDN